MAIKPVTGDESSRCQAVFGNGHFEAVGLNGICIVPPFEIATLGSLTLVVDAISEPSSDEYGPSSKSEGTRQASRYK